MNEPNNLSYLGERSYPAIVQSIRHTLLESQASTLVGNEILQKAFVSFNESKTPVMDLKEFTTNAETLAPHDAKLCEVVDFVKKKVKSGDLNFLINLCKEQDFSNKTRAGFPTTQATIDAYKAEMNEPANVVEALIKQGVFDSLESNLLMELKSDLDPSKNVINKGVQTGNVDLFENYAIYNPIGIRCDVGDKVVILTESCAIEKVGNSYKQANNDIIASIPVAHKRLMESIESSPFNPETDTFLLEGDWDMEMKLGANGKVVATVNEFSQEIQMADLPQLLMESVTRMQQKFMNYDKESNMRYADNFIILAENHSKLIKFDENYKCVRNLDSGKFVIFNESASTPEIIASSEGQLQVNSFAELHESIQKITEKNVINLFESQQSLEQQQVLQNIQKRQELIEQQNKLNQLIQQNEKLQKVAEQDSPAQDLLQQELIGLNESLQLNIEMIKSLM